MAAKFCGMTKREECHEHVPTLLCVLISKIFHNFDVLTVRCALLKLIGYRYLKLKNRANFSLMTLPRVSLDESESRFSLQSSTTQLSIARELPIQ